ncbi:MAG: FtsH protease activity modulator HflK [Bradymonadia bacterium]
MPWDPNDQFSGRRSGGGGGGGGGQFGPPELNIDPKQAVRIAIVVGAALIVGGLLITSGYSIEPQEKGVVMRFGEYHDTVSPGFHFKLPFGIDKVHRVATETVHKEEFGLRTLRADKRTTYSREEFDDESLLLTGDLNIADVEWVVQYKIVDPQNYLFKNEEPVKTLRDMSESVMRSVVGDMTVEEVLTVGRSRLQQDVLKNLQKKMEEYETGIQITSLELRDVKPPQSVQSAYNDVNKAQQDRERFVDEARREFNKQVPKAEGEALQRVQVAQGYRSQRINQALGDVQKFTRVYEEYLKAPDVTRRRMYLETMERVLPRMEEVILIDPDQQGLLPFLDLSGKGVGPKATQGGAR